MVKKDYVQPAIDVLSLRTMQETLQGASQFNFFIIGPDVTFSEEKSFDDYFAS